MHLPSNGVWLGCGTYMYTYTQSEEENTSKQGNVIDGSGRRGYKAVLAKFPLQIFIANEGKTKHLLKERASHKKLCKAVSSSGNNREPGTAHSEVYRALQGEGAVGNFPVTGFKSHMESMH